MNPAGELPVATGTAPEGDAVSLLDIATPLLESWKLIVVGSLLAGLMAYALTYLMQPVFTSRTVLLPPSQPQGAATAALSSLGNLAGVAGVGGAQRNPAEQYVALLQSTTVADRLIDHHKLMQVYEAKLRSDARRALGARTRVTVGKKDGLITVEVDDHDPQRAAIIANRYVDELRTVSSSLALTEAQQRRVFFEAELRGTRDRLAAAQAALQSSGYNPGALKSEPRAAAESYAQLQAQATAAEIRLQMLRRGLADSAPEVQQQSAVAEALRQRVTRSEKPAQNAEATSDYVSRFREFKYQETMFELFSRQYETARLDEAREGALIQVVDVAAPADRRTSPKRVSTAALVTIAALFVLSVSVLLREAWRRTVAGEPDRGKLRRLRSALGRPEAAIT